MMTSSRSEMPNAAAVPSSAAGWPPRESGSMALHDFDLQYVIEILRKSRWLILLLTASVIGVTAYYAHTVTPVYRSTATLLIESQGANVVSIEEIYDVDDTNSEYYQTQIELLKSRELARKTIEALNLWSHPELQGVADGSDTSGDGAGPDAPVSPSNSLEDPASSEDGTAKSTHFANRVQEAFETSIRRAVDFFSPDESTVAAEDALADLDLDATSELDLSALAPADRQRVRELRAIRNFGGRLDVDPVRKTKLIKVSYESADPELAAQVANELAEQYIASYLESKSVITANASQWLSRRLTQLKATLDSSERRLRDFKIDNGLVDIDGRVSRLNEQELLLLTNELSAARGQLAATGDLYRELESLRGSGALDEGKNDLSGVSVVLSDPIVRQIMVDQGRASRELDELLNRYGQRHPRVIDAMSQVETLKRSMRLNIDRIINAKEQEYRLLQRRVEDIESKLSEGKADIQEIGNKKFELDALFREAETNRKLYDVFFQRYTEARSANGLEEANARVAEAAVPGPAPIRPRKMLLIGMAAVGALALSISIAFLLDKIDDTIKGTRDVERKLNSRLIGVLPLVKRRWFGRRGDLPLSPIGHADRAGVFAEAINATRTSLCLDRRSTEYRILLITSSVPDEGKTTSSVNLAYSFGQQERVLLIEGDMRRPSIGAAIGLKAGNPGLSDLIEGRAQPSACIVKGVLGGAFDVIPSGRIPRHPLELLTSVRFERLLEELSKRYDRIIIDSAPVHAVTDAAVFSKFADAVLYVVKSHDTPVTAIRQGMERLRQADAKLVGVLVTQADMDKLRRYGGDIHYGSYYDSYGYSKHPGRKFSGKRKRARRSDAEVTEAWDFGQVDRQGRIRTIGDQFRSGQASDASREPESSRATSSKKSVALDTVS